MELPKYIQNKLKQQNQAVFKARQLQDEIENWCEKSGIDISSIEYIDTVLYTHDDVVGPLNKDAIEKLYHG